MIITYHNPKGKNNSCRFDDACKNVGPYDGNLAIKQITGLYPNTHSAISKSEKKVSTPFLCDGNSLKITPHKVQVYPLPEKKETVKNDGFPSSFQEKGGSPIC